MVVAVVVSNDCYCTISTVTPLLPLISDHDYKFYTAQLMLVLALLLLLLPSAEVQLPLLVLMLLLVTELLLKLQLIPLLLYCCCYYHHCCSCRPDITCCPWEGLRPHGTAWCLAAYLLLQYKV